jgi:hypothetical protein
MSQCIWYGEEKNLIKSEMQMLALFMVQYKTIMMFKIQPSYVSCRKCRCYKESCKRRISQDSGIDHISAAIEDCYRYWTSVKLKNFVPEAFASTWHVLHCNTCLSLQFVYNSIIGFISSCIEIACGWCQNPCNPITTIESLSISPGQRLTHLRYSRELQFLAWGWCQNACNPIPTMGSLSISSRQRQTHLIF